MSHTLIHAVSSDSDTNSLTMPEDDRMREPVSGLAEAADALSCLVAAAPVDTAPAREAKRASPTPPPVEETEADRNRARNCGYARARAPAFARSSPTQFRRAYDVVRRVVRGPQK